MPVSDSPSERLTTQILILFCPSGVPTSRRELGHAIDGDLCTFIDMSACRHPSARAWTAAIPGGSAARSCYRVGAVKVTDG